MRLIQTSKWAKRGQMLLCMVEIFLTYLFRFCFNVKTCCSHLSWNLVLNILQAMSCDLRTTNCFSPCESQPIHVSVHSVHVSRDSNEKFLFAYGRKCRFLHDRMRVLQSIATVTKSEGQQMRFVSKKQQPRLYGIFPLFFLPVVRTPFSLSGPEYWTTKLKYFSLKRTLMHIANYIFSIQNLSSGVQKINRSVIWIWLIRNLISVNGLRRFRHNFYSSPVTRFNLSCNF